MRIQEPDCLKKRLIEGENIVIAHWHGEEYGLVQFLPRYKVACMVSNSKDGELINNIIHFYGCKTVRGSSTRGAVTALKGIIRLARAGWNPSVAVDGPKGPRHEIKDGIVEIAKITKLPIYTLSISAKPMKIFEKSWNKAELPLPFAKIEVTWGGPIWVTKSDQSHSIKAQISASLTHCKAAGNQRLET